MTDGVRKKVESTLREKPDARRGEKVSVSKAIKAVRIGDADKKRDQEQSVDAHRARVKRGRLPMKQKKQPCFRRKKNPWVNKNRFEKYNSP